MLTKPKVGPTYHGIPGVFALADLPRYPSVSSIAWTTGWAELDEIYRLYPGQFTVVHGATNHGKALALNTKVPTANGWSTMGELQVGDTIFDECGRPCRVVRASEIMFSRPCYEISFGGGAKIIADADHQWMAIKHTTQQHLVRTTREIAETIRSVKGRPNYLVDLCQAIDGCEFIAPVDPYVLGVWLGDGHSNSGAVTCFDEEIIERIAVNGQECSTQNTAGRYTIRDLVGKLRGLELLGNKHIPPAYQRASIKQRLALLRGLMDTDGSCRELDRICEFTSVNLMLAQNVFELVSGLGLKATFLTGNATIDGRIISKKYRVCFVAPFAVFTLPRKVKRQRLDVDIKSNRRSVKGCVRVPSVPVRCIEVDSPSKLFLVTDYFIPTHNSTFLFNLVVNQVAQLGRRVFLYVPENERTLWDRLSMIWGDRSEDAWRVASEMGILIGSSVRKYADPPRTLPWILETGLEVHRVQKIDLMILDPWNEIEFSRPKEMSQTEFIGECLKYITGFCREHDMTLMLSAHPTKTGVQDGKIPGPYDIDGSAHWANKPDNVICVWRGKGTEVRAISQKVREIGGGKRGGVCYFTVDDETGVFTPQYGGSGIPNV